MHHDVTARFLSVFIFLTACSIGSAEDKNTFNAHIVLFVEDGKEVPDGDGERLQSLGLRAEAYFARWMKHWRCPAERSQIFARGEDDAIEVTLVRGKFSNAGGRTALPNIRKKPIESASKQIGLNPRSPATWWVFYHADGVKGFQGAGGPGGGVAINAYPMGEGGIPLDAELASPDLDANAIKGTIHEFGHALGLPHIGPRPALKLGNSLMGPINRAYWGRVTGKDEKVYLNEACASMLNAHPIFRNSPPPKSPPAMPAEVKVSNFKAEAGEDGQSISLSGTLHSRLAAHSVVVVDSAQNRFGDYWSRAYSSKVGEHGSFMITVDEPFRSGTLFLGFCFESGTNTGDGEKSFQAGSGKSVAYRRSEGGFDFEPAGFATRDTDPEAKSE